MPTREEVEKRRSSLSEVKQTLLEKRRQGVSLTEGSSNIIPLRPHHVPAPASFAQQRFWFIHQLEPDNAAYNDIRTLRVNNLLDAQILKRALLEIMRRHEILRSNFTLVDGQVQQILHPYESAASALLLQEIDLRQIPATEREHKAQRSIDTTVNLPFDLAQDLLWRPILIRMGETDTLFVCVIHHILSDGWGLDIFERELQTLYLAFQAEQPSPLPEPELQYADFAYWEQQLFHGDLWQKHITYWKQTLADISDQPLLYGDHPRQSIQRANKANTTFIIPTNLAHKLRALSSREGVTLFMTLLATFQLLLFRYSGREDISVGAPISSRSRPEFEQLIGCFINMLVLRTDFSGNPTFQELLRRVRTTSLAAYAHQDAPFEKLVADLAPVRDKNRNPFFQIILDFQNSQATSSTASASNPTSMNIATDVSRFDLIMGLWDNGTELSGGLFYNSHLFETSTIACIQDHFLSLLTSVTEDSTQHILDLPALTAAELQKIAVWNETRETDSKALLTLDKQYATEEEETAPRTPLEEILEGIWSRLLDMEWVGIHENFFKVGGHSLLATQLLVQVQDVLDIEIPLQLVFDAPTIAEFTEAILKDENNQKQVEKTIELLLSVAALSEDEVEEILEVAN